MLNPFDMLAGVAVALTGDFAAAAVLYALMLAVVALAAPIIFFAALGALLRLRVSVRFAPRRA